MLTHSQLESPRSQTATQPKGTEDRPGGGVGCHRAGRPKQRLSRKALKTGALLHGWIFPSLLPVP
jgi:hypothetical protein